MKSYKESDKIAKLKKRIIINKFNVIYFTIFILIFTAIFLFKTQYKQYDKYISQNPSINTETIVKMDKNDKFVQYFKLKCNYSNMKKIKINFKTYGDCIPDKGIKFELYNNKDKKIYEDIIVKKNIKDGEYYTINLKNITYNKGAYYYKLVDVDKNSNYMIYPTVWKSTGDNECTYLYANGQKQVGNIATIFEYTKENMQVYYIVFGSILILFLLSFADVKVVTGKLKIITNVYIAVINGVIIDLVCIKIGGVEEISPINIIIMTTIFLLFFELFIFGIMGNLLVTFIMTDTILLLYAVANALVLKYRGTPIVPADIFSLGTLGDVIGHYKITISLLTVTYFVSAIMVYVFLFKINKLGILVKLERHKLYRKHIIVSACCILIGLGGTALFTNGTVLEFVGVENEQWDATYALNENGLILNFMENLQYAYIKQPKGYSSEKAIKILNRYEESNVKKSSKPNIIMIMNESLADFYDVEGSELKLSEDPLTYIHGLSENTIKGNCYVSVCGGSTANSELEALTSNSMAFFPKGSVVYQLFPKNNIISIVQSLKENGYECDAIHPLQASNWNRDIIYKAMGFDKFITKEDFVNPEYIRFISDKETYKKVIETYENKGEKPLYIMDITVQGHGGYITKTKWEHPVTVKNKDFSYANEYLSSTYVSDKAFQYLINYFQKIDEPTIILMFGDHQPNLENEFFEKLIGKKTNNYQLKDMQKRYVTPYILWANYDIKEEEKDISVNQMSILVKETANLELTQYEKFVNNFSKVIPIINANGYMDTDGKWHELNEKNKYSELINEYSIVQYYIYNDAIKK